MQGGQTAFILLCVLSVTQSLAAGQVDMTEAETGSNVTLTCSTSVSDQGLFFWYKLQFGFMIQTVASGDFAKLIPVEKFNNSRFNVSKVRGVYSLFIRNVSKDDEATYFCQVGASYEVKFTKPSQLVVKGPKKKPKVNNVTQSSNVELVLLGNTVNLQCSVSLNTKESPDGCSDDLRVFWYKAGTESYADIMYISNSNCDVQKEIGCVYNLTKTVKNSSDAGVYYCAVLWCGEILFGDGTEVQIKKELCPYLIIFGTLLTCSLLVTFSVILVRRKQKEVCEQCKGNTTTVMPAEQDRAEAHMNSEDDEGPEISYAALHFSRKNKRLKKKREFEEEATYSTVRKFSERDY